MSLEELIERIVEVAEELNKESIDYVKIASLHSVLGKLVDCYKKRCVLSEIEELDEICLKIVFKRGKTISIKSREALGSLYTLTVAELQERLLPSFEEEKTNKIAL